MWSLSVKCCDISFSIHSLFVCCEVGLISGMSTLCVINSNVQVMTHEITIHIRLGVSNHLAAEGGFQHPCMRSLSIQCCDSSFSIYSLFVCGEVGLISGMTTLSVINSKVGVMTHETTIMLLALRIGGDSPNL